MHSSTHKAPTACSQLNADIGRINTRMKAALESAEASLALPAAPGGNGKAQMRKAGEPLSTEAADTNPHRHVMALQRRGIISNYGEVQRKTVVIIGLDGIGSAAAELLTRSGAALRLHVGAWMACCSHSNGWSCNRAAGRHRLWLPAGHRRHVSSYAAALTSADSPHAV